MVFKKLLASLGIGGPSVDTVLAPTATQPGGTLTGHVHIRGGGRDVDIEYVTLILSASAHVAGGYHSAGGIELTRIPVAGNFPLGAEATRSIPFTINVPHTTPFNAVYGNLLPGITLGLRTELSVAKSADKTDLDPVAVEPMRIQQQILDALGTIGCRFIRTDLRPGGHVGAPAPLVQRITFLPPFEGRPGPHLPRVAFTFATDPHGIDVTVETGPTGGDRYSVPHADAERGDWVDIVDSWLTKAFSKPIPTHGRYGHPGHHQPHPYAYRRGPGIGTAVAAGVGGAALGFLGGMVIADMFDDAFSPDEFDAGADFGDADFGDAGMGGFDGGDFGGGDF